MLLNNKYNIFEDVKEPEPNQTIWRYMNLEKFLDLILSESLFFCRVDKLSDKAEGTVPQKNVEEMYAETQKWDIQPTQSFAEKFVKGQIKNIISFKQFTLVNCWSMNEDESFALW
jgi:hypothetical protein